MSALSTFWSVWVIAIVFGTLIACGLLIQYSSKTQVHSEETDETTGHEYDGIQELDNPLPRWWVIMFWATIVFSVGYIAAYGLANMQGFLKVEVDGKQVPWSQTAQWQNEVEKFDEKVAPLFAEYAATPIPELIKNEEALKTGQRLFASNCSVCHGSGAKGAQGFPNLTDNDWLYGGSPEKIIHAIKNGLNGMMPARGVMPSMTDAQIDQTVQYVRSLSGLKHDAALAAEGTAVFMQACAACHGVDGKGNQMVGAPNLTDDIWLYGGSTKQIDFAIRHGRNGVMPPQGHRFTDEQVHVLAAYVYSLSNKESAQ